VWRVNADGAMRVGLHRAAGADGGRRPAGIRCSIHDDVRDGR